jgi:hypothetical protein
VSEVLEKRLEGIAHEPQLLLGEFDRVHGASLVPLQVMLLPSGSRAQGADSSAPTRRGCAGFAGATGSS